MPNELGPADVSRAEVLAVQTREADVHQDLAQAVVGGVQDEALRDRGAPRLQQPPGAAAPRDLHGRLSGARGCGGRGREQLPGRAEQRQLFEGGAAEAEGRVVVLRGGCGTARRADGAEVQDVLAVFAHGGHFPRLHRNVRSGLAGRGRGQEGATFYGGLKGEGLVGAVQRGVGRIELMVSPILEGGSIESYARVKEGRVGAKEDGLFVQGVEALFAAGPAALFIRRGFGGLASYWNF